MSKQEIADLLEQLFRQSQMRFGNAIKSRWMYDGDKCPGCESEVKAMKFKGKNALSLNGFIFREHGVLIAYMLCGKCARRIFREAETNPIGKSSLHDEIEKNLKQAFLKNLGH